MLLLLANGQQSNEIHGALLLLVERIITSTNSFRSGVQDVVAVLSTGMISRIHGKYDIYYGTLKFVNFLARPIGEPI